MDVFTGGPRVEYSRHLFGHFIEHFHRQIYGGIFDPGSPLSDGRGFRLDVLEALRELKVPSVRWPGGCFASAYDWLDGVGAARRPSYDLAWRVTDPNTFGTDEFIAWCGELGADPYICTNAGTGTPREMAAWVEYTNGRSGSRWADLRVRNGQSQPYGVPFWSIGNENYGDWEIGAKTSGEWSAFVTESAKMMLRVDESIGLLAAAVGESDWVIPMLQSAGRYLRYISIHGYWDELSQVDSPSSYLRVMAMTAEPERQISRARAMIEASGQRHIKIAFDEWNLRGWHHPNGMSAAAIGARDLNDDNSTYTMADAVFSATLLNSCLRNSDTVGMANIAPTVNARGPLFVHSRGIVKRTTFHVMSMYATLLGSRVLETSINSVGIGTGSCEVPMVDGIATAGEDGETAVVFVNKHDRASANVSLRIDGTPLNGDHPAVVLDGPGPDAYNDIENPVTVVPRSVESRFTDGHLTLPAHSVVVVKVKRERFRRESLEWFTTSRGIRRA